MRARGAMCILAAQPRPASIGRQGVRMGEVTIRRIGIVAQLVVGLSLGGVGPVHGQDADLGDVAPQPSVELPADLARVLRDYERYWSAGEEDRFLVGINPLRSLRRSIK